MLLLSTLVLAGCASVPNRPPRLEHSSYGCMSAAVEQKMTPQLPDRQAHCLAAGLIARYCSPTEAYLAGAGKEWRDLFTRGDAEWSDWQADRGGIGCARRAADDVALATCCASLAAPAK
jgi:hypothetical protein